jgi:hypothetical protein
MSGDNDLIDAKGLTIVIDILGYSSGGASPTETSSPASKAPKCNDQYCCYKSRPEQGSASEITCPSGYTGYRNGDDIVSDDHDLLDLKGLTITLDILNYSSASKDPVKSTTLAKDCSVCKASTCCVKQSSIMGSKVVSNDHDLIDLKGAKVNLCLLTFCL